MHAPLHFFQNVVFYLILEICMYSIFNFMLLLFHGFCFPFYVVHSLYSILVIILIFFKDSNQVIQHLILHPFCPFHLKHLVQVISLLKGATQTKFETFPLYTNIQHLLNVLAHNVS